MSRVRLELTVRDEDAEAVAAELIRDYGGLVQDSLYSWGNVTVEIRTDEEALQERLAWLTVRR